MNWHKEINIHLILSKDKNTDESAVLISKELATYLSKELHSYCTGNSDLDYIIKDLKKVKTQCQGNKVLTRLYDWADYSKVWLGS